MTNDESQTNGESPQESNAEYAEAQRRAEEENFFGFPFQFSLRPSAPLRTLRLMSFRHF